MAAPTSKPLIMSWLYDSIVRETSAFVAPSDGSVRCKRVTRLGKLVLEEEPMPIPDADVAQVSLVRMFLGTQLWDATIGRRH